MKTSPPRDRRPSFLGRLGPGLITGAADDDPGGVATHSQAGAAFGLNMLWSVVLAYPLLAGIQQVVARIGRVTGHGLAANIKKVFPRWLLAVLVLSLLVANTINIAADVAAMGAAAALVLPGVNPFVYAGGFGLACLLLEIFMSYKRYVQVLKWLTLSLLAYVGVVFTVKIPWAEVAFKSFVPDVQLTPVFLTMVVAVFGTTISPYMFFWQSSQEVEDLGPDPEARSLIHHPELADNELRRIRLDTWTGMAVCSVIAFFIVLTTSVTLHVNGVTDIKDAAQAAQALRPIAGDLAFVLFSLGIIGTGLLAVPVLAGSAAYAIAESFGWPMGLDRKLGQAPGFYAIIAAATLGGVALSFSDIDPIKALFWSAVLNGLVAVPIMIVAMLLASRRSVMGPFTIGRTLKVLGWTATAVMLAAGVGMFLI
ncbi:divalent metal cation transporter [Caulobacter sp. NIBR1757]|uniref:NRAMP family divalent metal transporter n=1 Tax=Caulobacter sp. NIBR1757 TaxID=3016000 RepID=UPI0022F07179|nr:divalent metal cation transporter [Caulobacter sp. NIBR1757]WGM38177.1 Divalent metal cation transporter MntH [Caulobacter sp. NIBR1757]